MRPTATTSCRACPSICCGPKRSTAIQRLLRWPNVEWSPSHYFADNANTLTVDDYALLGLRVGFDVRAGWSAYVEGRNLTDKRYISTVAVAGTASPTSQLFNPGSGRAVYTGLRYRF